MKNVGIWALRAHTRRRYEAPEVDSQKPRWYIHLGLVEWKGDLGEAKVSDFARALAHEDVEALEVPVRYLSEQREGGGVRIHLLV